MDSCFLFVVDVVEIGDVLKVKPLAAFGYD
jgi:hypothetical protein